MRILLIGGTQFVGRHIVNEFLTRGDEVTLFHRGRTNRELFSDLEHRLGDRNSDLSSLATGQWDVTVDTSAYVPRHVQLLSNALGPRGGHYIHISSVSVYAPLPSAGATEDAPHVVLHDATTQEVTALTYGGLKSLCEVQTNEDFGPQGFGWSEVMPTIVRPTYVAGPNDYTGRFSWWVERIARGGAVLAPGPRSNPFQVIDVRDCAHFVATLAHTSRSGVFHVAGPPPPFTFENFLDTVVREVGSGNVELRWVAPQLLFDAGVEPSTFPLWAALDESRHTSSLDSRRALAAGLQLRPLSETIRDVHSHEAAGPATLRAGVGVAPARERALLHELSPS